MKREKKEKVTMSYDEIMKAKEENPEFRTGKRVKVAQEARGIKSEHHIVFN